MKSLKVAVVGTGAMGGSMARCWSGKEVEIGRESYRIELEIVGRNREKGERLAEEVGGKFTLLSNFKMDGKVVVLAVKPYGLEEVARQVEGEGRLLISVMAGKKLEELAQIPAGLYLRAMPNLGALYGASLTGVVGSGRAKEIGVPLLQLIGEVVELESEDQLDIFTAIAGSGPAYLALVAEAMEDAGVYLGLTRERSAQIVKGLFKSFAVIKERSCIIKEKVMSPKGTTAEGILKLESGGVRGKIMEAVIDGYKKAKRI
jgi:pyrroline-5-carboxylate reductase